MWVGTVLVFVSWVFVVSGSQDEKLNELGVMYERLVKSNLNDLSVFNRENLSLPIMFFNPKLYHQDNFNESTAGLAVRSIMQFIDYEYDFELEKSLKCPTEGLKALYDTFPQVFSCFTSFDDMIKQIKCRILINQQNGNSYYEAFKLCPKLFNTSLVKTLEKHGHCLEGYLLSALLLHDNVMAEFVVHMMKDARLCKINYDFVDQPSRDDVWRYFFGNITVCLEMDGPALEIILMETIQNLLYKPQVYELIKRCKESPFGDVQNVIVFAPWVALCSPFGVCPSLTLDHVRSLRNDSNSSNGNSSLMSDPNGINHFASLPFEALVIIFEECCSEGVQVCMVKLSQVCKQFYTGTQFLNYHTHYRVITKSRRQAIRFINSVNRPTLNPSEITVGFPWNLSDSNQIFTLFVHSMTCHKSKITMRSLVRDYARGFPEFCKSNPLKQKWFESWATIIGYILANHRFESIEQYCKFAIRAISISPCVVDLLPNKHVEPSLVFIAAITEVPNVTDRLKFTPDFILSHLNMLMEPCNADIFGTVMSIVGDDFDQIAFSAFLNCHFGSSIISVETLKAFVDDPSRIERKECVVELINENEARQEWLLQSKEKQSVIEYIIMTVLNEDRSLRGITDGALIVDDNRLLEGISEEFIKEVFAYFCEHRLPRDMFVEFIRRIYDGEDIENYITSLMQVVGSWKLGDNPTEDLNN